MALAVGNTARSLFGLRRIAVNRALVGKWLQNQLCTSAKLSQTSESSGEKNTKIYEVRTYYVKPKAFGKEILFSNVFFPPKIITGLKDIRSEVYTARVGNAAPMPLPRPILEGVFVRVSDDYDKHPVHFMCEPHPPN